MILFTALIGPYFVDWTTYRDSFQRQASAYVGLPVTVAGRAAVRLLPTPVVTFTDLRVGDSETPVVEMERFRAEVELAPLLRGEVRIIQMAFERPVFRVDIAQLRAGGGIVGGIHLDPERVSLERLEIEDGAAVISDSARGRTWRAEKIDATVEADTLMGPGRLEAGLILNGHPAALSIGFGRIADNSVVAKASLRSPEVPVTLAADGSFGLAEDGVPQYQGTATVVGVPPADDSAPRSPWADFRANGGFILTPAGVDVDKMQLSYGATERPLILEASGAIGFADQPHFDIRLAARQIDLDRTLGGGSKAPVAIEDAVPALLARLPDLPLPPIPGELALAAQGVVVGGGVIQGVEAHLRTGTASWAVEDLSATLPGDTRVALSGDFGLGDSPTFSGHASLVAERPPAFAAWWRGVSGSAAAIGQLSVDADLDLGKDHQSVANLVARTGAGTTTGSVDINRFPQSGRYIVAINLSADRADLLEAQAIAGLVAGKAMAASDIEQLTLSLRADALTAGGVEARDVTLDGGFANGEFALTNFSVADLAGASVKALGTIRDPFGKRSGNIEASVRADDFRGAAEFLASLVPGTKAADRLREAAPVLSPVVADISADLGAKGERLRLELNGSFAATHLVLKADGKGSLDDPASLSGTLNLQADGADSATVLRQLGFSPLPLRSPPMNLEAEFTGALAESGALKAAGSIAGIDFDYTATTAVADGAPRLSGTFNAKSKDIDQAMLLAGIAMPGIGEGHAASLSGTLDYAPGALRLSAGEGRFDGEPATGDLAVTLSAKPKLEGRLSLGSVSAPLLVAAMTGTEPTPEAGRWRDAAFAAALPQDVSIDLAITAGTLDLGAPLPATNATLDFRLSPGSLTLDVASAELAGGALKGSLGVAVADGEANVSLRGGLKGASLDAIAWERAGLPVASGAIDIAADAAGHGRSAAAVVASLSGSGSYTIEDARLNALNPEALTAVMAMAEGDKDPDEEVARETFQRMFGSGALEIGRVAGSFSIADGIMSVPTVSLESGTTGILAGASFDLNRLTLSSNWQVRAGEVEDVAARPSVEVRFSGPIAAPERRVDFNPLLNLLRSRFLQRQLAELEQLEQERQRIEAQRKAEEAARHAAEQAEAERRAREAAAAAQSLQPLGPDAPAATGATGDSTADPIAAEPDSTPPIELVPETAPAPPSEPPKARQSPPRRAAVAPEPEPQLPEYRQLPNGTIVKIR